LFQVLFKNNELIKDKSKHAIVGRLADLRQPSFRNIPLICCLRKV